jgi:hypothetical protein
MKKPSDILKDYANAVKLVNPSKFDFLIDEIPRIIKIRTRLGKGVNNGDIVKLNQLSSNYIKFRKKLLGGVSLKQHRKTTKSTNDKGLSGETTPGKSNLTLSGEMLDSIKGRRDGLKFTFFFGNTEANNKAKWASENGRPFFELSNSEKNGIFRRVTQIIKEELRSIFK